MKKFICGSFLFAFLMTGCAGMNDTQQRVLSGAMIGAGGGAVIGALTGGPAVGAAVGAGAGALAGLAVDHNAKKMSATGRKTARKHKKSKTQKAEKARENTEG